MDHCVWIVIMRTKKEGELVRKKKKTRKKTKEKEAQRERE